jgi:hypothetical protein
MYISSRAALVRNLAVAILNGSITLIILLIAPMGLAGVITNTLLITVSSFFNACLGDGLVRFLTPRNHQELQAFIKENVEKSLQIHPHSQGNIQKNNQE